MTQRDEIWIFETLIKCALKKDGPRIERLVRKWFDHPTRSMSGFIQILHRTRTHFATEPAVWRWMLHHIPAGFLTALTQALESAEQPDDRLLYHVCREARELQLAQVFATLPDQKSSHIRAAGMKYQDALKRFTLKLKDKLFLKRLLAQLLRFESSGATRQRRLISDLHLCTWLTTQGRLLLVPEDRVRVRQMRNSVLYMLALHKSTMSVEVIEKRIRRMKMGQLVYWFSGSGGPNGQSRDFIFYKSPEGLWLIQGSDELSPDLIRRVADDRVTLAFFLINTNPVKIDLSESFLNSAFEGVGPSIDPAKKDLVQLISQAVCWQYSRMTGLSHLFVRYPKLRPSYVMAVSRQISEQTYRHRIDQHVVRRATKVLLKLEDVRQNPVHLQEFIAHSRVDEADARGRLLVFWAAIFHMESLIPILIPCSHLKTWQIAILTGDMAALVALLKQRLVEAEDAQGLTPIHWAIAVAESDMVTVLMLNGFDPQKALPAGEKCAELVTEKIHYDKRPEVYGRLMALRQLFPEPETDTL